MTNYKESIKQKLQLK